LPGAGEIGEFEIHEFYLAVLDDFGNVGRGLFIFSHGVGWSVDALKRFENINGWKLKSELLNSWNASSLKRLYGFNAGVPAPHTAFSPISSVRMRTACSTGRTKTLPSPILPVLAALTTTVTALSTMSSASTTSTFTLGRKSTVYSLPR